MTNEEAKVLVMALQNVVDVVERLIKGSDNEISKSLKSQSPKYKKSAQPPKIPKSQNPEIPRSIASRASVSPTWW